MSDELVKSVASINLSDAHPEDAKNNISPVPKPELEPSASSTSGAAAQTVSSADPAESTDRKERDTTKTESTYSHDNSFLYEDFVEFSEPEPEPSASSSTPESTNSSRSSAYGQLTLNSFFVEKQPSTPQKSSSSSSSSSSTPSKTPPSKVKQRIAQNSPQLAGKQHASSGGQVSPLRPRASRTVVEASNSNSVPMPVFGASITLQLELSDDQWKECEICMNEWKRAKQEQPDTLVSGSTPSTPSKGSGKQTQRSLSNLRSAGTPSPESSSKTVKHVTPSKLHPSTDHATSTWVPSPSSGDLTTISLKLSEEQWKEVERRMLEQTFAKQFEGAAETMKYADRTNNLGNYLLPPIYTYSNTEEEYHVWKQKYNKSGWVPTNIVVPKFCNSSHFKRIEYLRKYFPVTDAKPTELKDCLYYAILILPGAPQKYRDQGYIGIAEKNSVTARWSGHNEGSIVDRNLRLLQRYFDGKPFEEFSQYAAIFVLGRPKHDTGQKIPLRDYESYLMNTDFCPEHGCRAAKSKEPTGTQKPKRSPRQERKREDMSECEETCQIKGCDAKCIRLTDMRYGMNKVMQSSN